MANEAVHVKKIGSFIILISMLATLYSAAADPRVFLTVHDTNGDMLEQAAAGVPFVAEVAVQGLEGADDSISIAGTEKFALARQGVTKTVINDNGVVTSKLVYRYAIRIDSPGTYQIGPVHVAHSGREYTSQPIRVQVGKKKTYKQQPKAEIVLSIDKDLIVPGQSTLFRIRFYADESISLSSMTNPDFGALHAGKLEGPFSGYDTTGGESRYYLEWRTDLYADVPGSYRIPAISAEYRMPRKQGSLMVDDFFGGLFSRGGSVQQQTSNSLEITVNSLPRTDKKVDGVGLFSALSLSIDQNTIQRGDGTVLKVELTGTENIERVQAPELRMPDGLNYYDSKTYVDNHPTYDGQTKKVFEYIVQGTQPGLITIPPQTFTFFNLYTRTYTTLTSNAVQIEILPAPTQQVDVAPHDTQSIKHVADTCLQEAVAHELLDGPVYAAADTNMAWWLFMLLLALPLCALFCYFLFALVQRYLDTHRWFVYRSAYWKARRAINRVCAQQQYGQLYILFKQFFIDRYGQGYGTHESMLMLLREKKVTEDELHKFDEFLRKIAAFTFGNRRVQDGYDVRGESQQWLDWVRKSI